MDLIGGKGCELRHPRPCRYFRKGKCWWRESCVYLHETSIHMNDEHKEEHAHDEINDIELELMDTSLNDKQSGYFYQ